MSSVSCAMRYCFSDGTPPMVRMLCSRSASLMISTRMSRAIATSILRIVAACCASFESKWMRSSLVTPSTIVATSAPNPASTSATVISVSSTASCRSAAARQISSSPISATIRATEIGWLMYASPLERRWLPWARAATS